MKLCEMPLYPFIKPNMEEYEIVHFKKGEYIERSTTDSGAIYYLISGSVRQEAISYCGNKVLIDHLSPGGFAGHVSKIRGSTFCCDAVASSASKLLKITHAQLKILHKNPAFAIFFYMTTSERIYSIYKKMLMLKLYSQEEIVAYYILTHAVGDVFVYKSMYKICEELSISRRGLYNIINKFVDQNCLQKNNTEFMIVDKEQLSEIARNITNYYAQDDNIFSIYQGY